MKVNVTKCAVIRCSILTTLQYNNKINHQPINTTDHHPYLGVTIHGSTSWASHINTIVLKASRTSSKIFICAQKKLRKQPILPL